MSWSHAGAVPPSPAPRRRPLELLVAGSDDPGFNRRARGSAGTRVARDPRSGGVLLLRVPDVAALDAIREADPFTRAGCGQYELLPWVPSIGGEDLDRL
jgi:hypothetical protein